MTEETTDPRFSEMTDSQLAVEIAQRAATRLLELRSEHSSADGAELKRIGDEGAQALIASILESARPEDAVLSEEAKDSSARLTAPRVWIIDPLDGTREYSEGRDDWAVHVALVVDGELALGAVALGGPEVVLSSQDTPSEHVVGDPWRIAVSRSRPPAIVAELGRLTGAEFVPMGSAGVKVCAVVRGDVDAYVHGGGQFEWDSAAPVAVARAAGLHTSRLDGSALEYNRPDPYLPDLIVCKPQIADRIQSLVDSILNASSEGEAIT